MEVFISWTGADRDVKNAIVERLQEENIACWDSDVHCTSDYSPECIAAIRRCGVFIVIVSDASMAKGYVQNEVITARNLENEGKLNILVYKITDSPYTDAFEFQLNHISFVTGNLIHRTDGATGDSGIDTIVKRTKRLLQQRLECRPEKPFDVHMPEIDGLKLAGTGYFVEHSRDDILAAMEEALERSNVIVLRELFGFGKRSVIRKFVELHREDYSTTVMVNNNNNGLRAFFLAELQFTNVNQKRFESLEGEELLKEKLRLLEKLDETTLLVIPNVTFEPQPDPFLCERLMSLRCRIILVTQESAEQYRDRFPIIRVGRMTDAHLSELFFHHYDRAYEEDRDALAKPLEQFYAGIGGHTKTTELTASVLRELGVYPEQIPDYLSMHGSEGLQLKDRVIRQISYIFDIEKLSTQELAALLVAAYIAVPYVSEKNYRMVLRACGVDDWQTVMQLDKRRWLDVDMRNRTVSIEPLVAQVVLQKFPDLYFVIIKCFDYLTENSARLVSFSASKLSSISGLGKLAYLFSVTGLEEMAELLAQCRQYSLDKKAFDPRSMADAVARYEARYPATPAHWEADDADEDAADRDTYEAMAKSALASGVLPLAKLISSDIGGLFMDFTPESSRILAGSLGDAQPDYFDMEAMIGLSKEEFYALLHAFREEMEAEADFDEESVEYIVTMEAFAVMDAVYKRDYAAFTLALHSIRSSVSKTPALLQNERFADTFYTIMSTIGRIFISSGAYHQALLFCEETLRLASEALQRNLVVQVYISALRYCEQYTQALFDAYAAVIASFDQSSKDTFDNRADMLRAKKEWVLLYAGDLARGERPDDAMAQFAAAQKLGALLLPDDTVKTAQEVVDALIRFGRFEDAVAYLERHFDAETMRLLSAAVGEDAQQSLADFTSYRELASDTGNEFTSGRDPEKYISYYHAFSRKNNGFLEQKYCDVADKAMRYDFSHLTDAELTAHADELRRRAKREKPLRLAPEAFALAGEAGMRVLGYRHHYVQYMGAAAMADGKIAEILNGEGKTYTLVLVAFLHALYDRRVLVIDESAYLTKRNYDWMHGVYDLLGVSNAHLANVDGFVLKDGARQAEVTYARLFDLIFGFLRSELSAAQDCGYLRLDCAVIDEIDNVLVDEAKRPYNITSAERLHTSAPLWHNIAYRLAQKVAFDETYYTCRKKNVTLSPKLYPLIEQRFGVSYANIDSIEQIREIEHIVSAAILCCNHYEKGSDYFIHNGTPVWENRKKGVFETFLPTYEYFLRRRNGIATGAVEKTLASRSRTEDTICVRDFFKKFDAVCGATATAVSFRREFSEIYGLEYISVPPCCPCVREDRQSPVYASVAAKDQAILETVAEKHGRHQPILLITQSVAESEKYAALLTRAKIPHKLLNAKNTEESADMLALAGVADSVLVANALASRGADIKLGGSPELKTRRELVESGADVTALDSLVYAIPTQERRETELYRAYLGILEKNKALTARARRQVIEAGGLCVIGTSFFPEPRTEQQTRGRSGRQGAVGESIVFRSLEDETLRPLFSQAMLDRIRSMCTEDDAFDMRILYKAMQNAQSKLHHASFAEIRTLNNTSWYIDQARPYFLGRRQALRQERLSPDALLLEWARDKKTQDTLKRLQKGETVPEARLLTLLYGKYGQTLDAARGGRAEVVLLEVLKAELAERFGPEYDVDEVLRSVFGVKLLRCWGDYIALVERTVGKVDMSERAMERFFEAERWRLMMEAVEQMYSLRVGRRGS